MMKNLHFKSLAVVLLSLFGLTAAMAAPAEGTLYRLKNARNGKYLTMTSGSNDVTMSTKESGRYQYWKLVSSADLGTSIDGDYVALQNVGYEDAGSVVVLRASNTTASATYSGGSYSFRNCLFTVEEGTYSGQTAYKFTLYDKSFGLWSPADAASVKNGTDDGVWWVLEEDEKPQIVTIQNKQSGRYLYDKDGLAWQKEELDDDCQWVLVPDGEGFQIVNVYTGRNLGTPEHGAQVTTGTKIETFTLLTAGDYTAIGVGLEYLNNNAQKGEDVCGWTGGLSNEGNCWKVERIGEISLNELYEKLMDAAGYASAMEDGGIYRLLNAGRTCYAAEDYYSLTGKGQSLNESYAQVWRAVSDGNGRFYLQNVLTNHYLSSGEEILSKTDVMVADKAEATAYQVVKNGEGGGWMTHVNLLSGRVAGGNPIAVHMSSSLTLVNWYPDVTGDNASQWLLVKASVDADQLAAQQAEYADEAGMFANVAKFQTLLDKIFADKACTTLNSEYAAMSADEFATAIDELPELLKAMCLKIKNNSWTLSKGGNNWEKFFRIADYKVYSNSTQMCWQVGMSYLFSRLSNPTGICADEGDVLAIMVDREVPANAALALEITDGDGKSAPRFGDQTTLKKGLNLIPVNKLSNIYIYYEITGYTDSESFYLEKFPDITIHIEGGTVNGYFDLTRNMDDKNWADMVQSGMLMHGRVQLKGSHVMGNWPSAVLVPNNKTSIMRIANFYNNIPKWEQEIMGINDTYIPNISKRYRNVFAATGGDLGDAYMYATSYGTYYNYGTLSTILSSSVLTNAGSQWGPGHEFGHNHQNLFNMVGCTEVSNNVFTNAVIYKMGAGMSRGIALSLLIPAYAAQKSWIELYTDYDNGIWCMTQMYWKLYQFFHLAGRDTEFFPKVFSIMRKNGMNRRQNVALPATDDYLRFVEVCCEAADADLSEFFEMYGFFRPFHTTKTVDGKSCIEVGDYGTYYLYVTNKMIADTKAYCQKFEKKYKNIGFIDDRIRQTPATYEGAPAGTMRSGMNGGGDNSVGSEGTVGMYLDYYAENYVPVTQYTATVVTKRSGVTSIDIDSASGQGAMGFKVYDKDGNLIYFYNDYSFSLPASLADIYDFDKTNITIVAADAFGNDVEVYNPSKVDAVTSVKAADRQNATYDLQGRRVSADARGLLISGGKKVVR